MPKLYRCEFQIEANVPKTVFNAFLQAQAQVTGVKGWVENTANGVYKGVLEGSKETIEKMQTLIEKSAELATTLKKSAFAELKEIEKYTQEKFETK